MKKRERLLRLLLLGGSVAVSIVLFEVAVFVVEAGRGPLFPGGTRTSTFTQFDRVLGWKHVPGIAQRYGWPEHPDGFVTIVTNELGLREDHPTPQRPPADRFRVLVLGDSHTDGLLNNEESWPNVLERIAADQAPPWEVLNAGVTGYEPSQYYLSWDVQGRSLDPELVVLGYYLGNDLLVAEREVVDRLGDAGTEIAEGAQPPQGRSLWDPIVSLRRRCRLCALLSVVAHRWLLDGPTLEEAGYVRGVDEEQRARHLAALRHCTGCVWQSLEQAWLIRGNDQDYAQRMRRVEDVLRLLRDDVEAAGARFAVVVIPSKLQVEPDAATRAAGARALLGLADVTVSLEDRLEADVIALLERLGIETVEVREALEEERARTGDPMYYGGDWHLNVIGSEVVGSAVGAALLDVSGR